MVFRAVGRKLGIIVAVVLEGSLRDCFLQLMNLLIENIVACCCVIPSSWSEIMDWVVVVVMLLYYSMLLTKISGRGGC